MYNFTNKLFILHPSITKMELRICLLLKIKIPVSTISQLVCRTQSAVSMSRKQLYKKIFNKGDTQNLDDFIVSFKDELNLWYSTQRRNTRIQVFSFTHKRPVGRDSGWRHSFTTHSWSFMKGVRCFSPFQSPKQFRLDTVQDIRWVPLSVSESTIPQVSEASTIPCQPAPFKGWKSPIFYSFLHGLSANYYPSHCV